jgi:hypothetical protein
MQSMGDAAAGKLDPETGQPIPTCDWIDRLAPRAHAVLAALPRAGRGSRIIVQLPRRCGDAGAR